MSFTFDSFAYFWFPLILIVGFALSLLIVRFALSLLHEIFVQSTDAYKAKHATKIARQRVIFFKSLNK